MRLTITALFLSISASTALAQQPSEDMLMRGLLNLATIQQLATAIEYQKVAHGGYQLGADATENAAILNVDPAQLRDPWGTPYRLELLKEGGYRIVGAGADKAFDESTWGARAETKSLDADTVLVAGDFVRTNKNWLIGFLTPAQKSEQNLSTAFPRGDVYRVVNTVSNAYAWLRIQEIATYSIMTDPKFADVMRERITQDKIRTLSERFLKARNATQSVRGVRIPRVVDEWGTALEISYVDPEGSHFRIASAGADKRFNQATWSKPIASSLDEDLVFDDASWTRVLDLDTMVQPFLPPELQAKPSVTKLKTTTGQQIYKVGGDVAAPVPLIKSDVPYPTELEGRRQVGIAEVTIDATGHVMEVKPMMGLSPAADRMIADAISRWEFKPATKGGQPVAVIYTVTLTLAPR